jgi:hypothetical protein
VITIRAIKRLLSCKVLQKKCPAISGAFVF